MYETFSSKSERRLDPEEAMALIESIMDEMSVSPGFYDRMGMPAVAQGLVEACNGDREKISEYLDHSDRFNKAAYEHPDLLFGESIPIPQSEQNLDERGLNRPEESGPKINVENLEQLSINPHYVLMFRVTQPSDTPKPELYWTSDPAETDHGLNVELGNRQESAVILAASLHDIAQNGGLIRDINDDSGVAVRQLGRDTFDQAKALFTMVRGQE